MNGEQLKRQRQALSLSPTRFAELMGNICSIKTLERLEWDGEFNVLSDDIAEAAERVFKEVRKTREAA